MEVQPKQPTVKGPTEWFTGDVWIDAIARGRDPSHLNVGAVHFSPGARTAWHSHDGGQTLYVTEGRGRCNPAVIVWWSFVPGTRSTRPMVRSTGTVRHPITS